MTPPSHYRGYLKLGWSVLPIAARSKLPDAACLPLVYDPETGEMRPSWKPLQERPATRAEVRAWHQTTPGGNVGIVTGTVSGLVVLDLDSPEALAAIQVSSLPRTPIVQSAHGLHLYFQHPGGVVGNRTNLFPNAPGCDLRGDGGYIVAPPSLHPSGVRYRWQVPPTRVPLAPLPTWLVEALMRPQVAPGADATPWSGELGHMHEAARLDEPRESDEAALLDEPAAAPCASFPAVRWQAYAEAAIQQELATLRAAQVGERNHRLNRAAFALGQWVALGMVEASLVTAQLAALAAGLGLPEREATRTIRSGLRAGQARPRRLPTWVQNTPPQPHHSRRAAPTRRRW